MLYIPKTTRVLNGNIMSAAVVSTMNFQLRDTNKISHQEKHLGTTK